MAITASESTLLANVKTYLARSDETLSKEAMRMLSKVQPLKKVMRRMAREAPDLLKPLLVELTDTIKIEQEQRLREEKERRERKRAAEAYGDVPDSQESAKRARIRRITVVETSHPLGSTTISDGRTNIQQLEEDSSGSDTEKEEPILQVTRAPNTSDNHTEIYDTTFEVQEERELDEDSGDGGVLSLDKIQSTSMDPSFGTMVISAASNILPMIPDAAREASPLFVPYHSGINMESQDNEATSGDTLFQSGEPQTQLLSLQTTSIMVACEPKQVESVKSIEDHQAETGMANALEISIIDQEKAIMEDLVRHFKKQILPRHTTIQSENVDEYIREVLIQVQKLNFDTVQLRLLEFAEQHLKKPSTKISVNDLVEHADPVAVFQTIQNSSANETDSKLWKAYGQIQLIKSIDWKIASGYKPASLFKRVPGIVGLAGFYLDEMANRIGSTESEKERMRGRLRREHGAGQQWQKMVEKNGGMGVVFVFILA
ncbi:MAG: hypothetical protein Q9218_007517, partial [Villophora microphyllina]